MSKVVGIDLGTTNSLVAYVKDGVPVVIRDRSGDGLVPSVVSAAEDGAIYVGREAERRLLDHEKRRLLHPPRYGGAYGRDHGQSQEGRPPREGRHRLDLEEGALTEAAPSRNCI